MPSRKSFLLAVVLVAALVLAACGGSERPMGTNPPAAVTSEQATTVAPTPQSTSILPEISSTSEADTAIRVVLRLPDDWSAATVWASSDDYPDVAPEWEATGPMLEVALPGAGSYVFLAETPSSDDGLCFYQAQSHPQWEPVSLRGGESVVLALSGEVCE